MKTKKQNKLKVVLKLLFYILFLICILLFSISIYIKKNFQFAIFEQLFLTMLKAKGTSFNAIYEGIKFTILLFSIFIIILIVVPIIIRYFSNKLYELKIFIKGKKILSLNFPIKISFKYLLLIMIVMLYLSIDNFGIITYLKNQLVETKIYENYYINPKYVDIIFPEKKKNLIYIYVESMENTYSKMLNNNGDEISYIPELDNIAKENINFSNTNQLGGAYQVSNTGWTVASMVAQTSGVPLNISITDKNLYKGYSSFLGGAYSLGEILANNGYNNYMMLGSLADFGGRDQYFHEHGNYEIYDLITARLNGSVPIDYYENWGFEDAKLFEYAKQKLLEISSKKEPFNFTMLTADTHFPNGYMDKGCKQKYPTKYANSIACSSKKIDKFLKWIKKQKFYNDTTIIIVGDHLTMEESDFNDYIDKNIERTIYNAIINSSVDTKNTNNRYFSVLDMFPTTLAAMGAYIPGDRLGLGTNLFSDKQTLIEKLGFEYFNDELAKKSSYYNIHFLENSFIELEKSNNGDV